MTISLKPELLLEVRNLSVEFRTDGGWIKSVDDVNFSLAPREALGLVGESGSGKSVTALSLLRLHDQRNSRMGGSVRYKGEDLLTMPINCLRNIRGHEIAMVFQDPIHTLNPVLTIGRQIEESLRLHHGLQGREARKRAIELLDRVRIPDAARRIDDYPHRLSGGQRQRVMIAIAIAGDPKVLIADEPTTALDVTVQAQIMELLRNLRDELSMSVILISHDLGLVSEFADRAMVMYAGQPVEAGPIDKIFDEPLHPYTEGLLSAIPDLDQDLDRLPTISGSIPEPSRRPPGCRFAPRCAFVQESCVTPQPMLSLNDLRSTRCPPRLPSKECIV